MREIQPYICLNIISVHIYCLCVDHYQGVVSTVNLFSAKCWEVVNESSIEKNRVSIVLSEKLPDQGKTFMCSFAHCKSLQVTRTHLALIGFPCSPVFSLCSEESLKEEQIHYILWKLCYVSYLSYFTIVVNNLFITSSLPWLYFVIYVLNMLSCHRKI